MDCLQLEVKRAGVTSGPLLKGTRHSNLSLIKEWLLGGRLSFGYRAHNNFGSCVHSMFLEKKRGRWKLTGIEEAHMKGMLTALSSNPIVISLLKQCNVFEKRKHTRINNVKISYTCDGTGKAIILDLKTSSTSSLKAFVESAIKYGYIRQGVTYMKCEDKNEYWLIGIQKLPPYQVYLVHINKLRDEIDYANAELNFLLYFYQRYGNPKGIK